MTNQCPSAAEIEQQKRAFLQKLIEMIRKSDVKKKPLIEKILKQKAEI